jgi:phosphate transport system protein
MSERSPDRQQTRGGVGELERQVVALGNLVESLFADSLVALIDANPGAVPGLCQDDRRAHERWLDIDRLSTELLTNGELESTDVQRIWAANKIATDLKHLADESWRVGDSVRLLSSEVLTPGRTPAPIARMAGLAQSMLGDAIEAFVNHNAAEAGALQSAFREVTAMKAQALEELSRAMASGETQVPAGVTLAGLVEHLEHIAGTVLDISTNVRHPNRHNEAR